MKQVSIRIFSNIFNREFKAIKKDKILITNNDVPRSGHVFVLRTCHKDGKSYNNFQWPLEPGSVVEAPDWDSKPLCGNGLHGFLKGEGNGNLANWDNDAVWMVLEVKESDIVYLKGKVKFPKAKVIYAGDRLTAAKIISDVYPKAIVVGGTAAAGKYGTAAAGDYGTAAAGKYGTANTGYGGTATTGYGGTATTGDGGTATTGDYGTATTGYGGTAAAGDYGIISIKYHDANRFKLKVGYIGENLSPNTPYRLDSNNNFVERVNFAT